MVFEEYVDDGQGIDVGDGIIPLEFVERLVAAMLRVPVPDRKAMLDANMVQLDAALDRSDRSRFERLSRQRGWIKREWMA